MVVSGSPNHRYVRIQEASLETVAALMRHYAHFHPWREGIDRAPYFRRLARGLGLFFILNADEGEYQLTLSRPQVYPSDLERTIVEKAFGSPITRSCVRDERLISGQAIKMIRITWPVQMSLLEESDGNPAPE
ncbi:MAG: hypothetical protein A2Z04_06660 [Chloroflexi bacterium RBG_16_57_9]|nr:MAG: hypothetical protein A2Z04_06660 [Chloroflexi bacterium RBG_16_57_9]